MTDKQKFIYNMYLQASSLGVGHPFKRRENFDGFEDENAEEYEVILKLEKVFKDLPGLNVYDYFAAPYKMFPEQFNYKLDMKWYLTFMAMKCYKQTFYHQFEHNLISNDSTKADISKEFDTVAEWIRQGNPLKPILKPIDEITPPKWVNLYYKHAISDWFIIAFKLVGRDLISDLNPMFASGIVSEDHIEFIDKNFAMLGNPQRIEDKMFLTNNIKKLIDAEKERASKFDKK